MFNFKEELLKYCESDVRLLGARCRAFRTNFEKEARFDTMVYWLTITAASMQSLRTKCLRPDTIILEPPSGWDGLRLKKSRRR